MTTKSTSKNRRMPLRRSKVLYLYVEPSVKAFAVSRGRTRFGTTSAYVNALLRLDRRENLLPEPIVVTKLKKALKKKRPLKTRKVSGKKSLTSAQGLCATATVMDAQPPLLDQQQGA
jgi:hypothetical protein